ncbi:MAG: fasciclin domain-containing protein [Candidatus Saccharimonadales bacterium]
MLKKQKQIKIFNELLVEADVVTTLQGQGPYTVLAPTDDAFKALPEGLLDTLKKPENKDNLRKLMQYHIVKGNLSAESLQNGQKASNRQWSRNHHRNK